MNPRRLIPPLILPRIAGRRAFFVAEALLGLAVLALIAAAAVAAIRWHLRAIGIDGHRNGALMTVEQSIGGLRSPGASQATAPSAAIIVDPAAAPAGYHWVQVGAGKGNQSVALFALVPVAPAPSSTSP